MRQSFENMLNFFKTAQIIPEGGAHSARSAQTSKIALCAQRACFQSFHVCKQTLTQGRRDTISS